MSRSRLTNRWCFHQGSLFLFHQASIRSCAAAPLPPDAPTLGAPAPTAPLSPLAIFKANCLALAVQQILKKCARTTANCSSRPARSFLQGIAIECRRHSSRLCSLELPACNKVSHSARLWKQALTWASAHFSCNHRKARFVFAFGSGKSDGNHHAEFMCPMAPENADHEASPKKKPKRNCAKTGRQRRG